MEDIKKEFPLGISSNIFQTNQDQNLTLEDNLKRSPEHTPKNNLEQIENNPKINNFFFFNKNQNSINKFQNFTNNNDYNSNNIYNNDYNNNFNNIRIETISQNNIFNNNINSVNNINLNIKEEKINNNIKYPINTININQMHNFYSNNNQDNNKNEKTESLNEGNTTNNKDNFKYLIKKNILNNLFNSSVYNEDNLPKQVNKDQIQIIIHNIEVILTFLSNFKGSIFLQNILMMMDNIDISILLNTIFPHIIKIMCLEYGNYFMQKLIKKCNYQQRINIYQIIENSFLEIATNKSGTHSIQSLIEAIETPMERLYLEKLLNKNMLLLINDENGYHIIMKIILEIPENQRNNLNLFLIAHLEQIIVNRYGAYCATKFIINNSNLSLRILLINNIQKNLKLFIFDKNSCSVIMLAIKKFGINNFEFIIKEIQDNLPYLSLHPNSYSFILKILSYLKINEYYKLSNIIWNVYRNDNLVGVLYSHKNGIKLIKKLMEYSNNTQKNYIKAKINFIKKCS